MFNIFAQNIDCEYADAVLMSTNNLSFGAKIRKIGISQWGLRGYVLHGHISMIMYFFPSSDRGLCAFCPVSWMVFVLDSRPGCAYVWVVGIMMGAG